MARAPHPSDPALASIGLALVAATQADVSLLAMGGLATIATVVLTGALVGAPAAVGEWRAPAPPTTPMVVERGLFDALSLLLVATVAGQALHGLGPLALVVAALGWGAAAGLAPWPRSAGVLGLLVITGAGAGAGAAVVESVPWTLLEPRWGTAGQWGPEAVVLGLLLALAGTGQWTAGPPRRPGQARAPWAPFGAGVLLTLLVALRAAASWEQHLGQVVVDPVWLAVAGGATLAGGTTVLARSPRSRWRRAALGLLATLWFAGPAFGALGFWWQAVLPLGLAATLLLVASRQSGAAPIAPSIGAILALGAAVWGWPGVPASALDAGAAGLVIVCAFWAIATATARSRSTA